MKITGSTIFSGGEGVGVAMRACGITHLQGLEFDERIANVARINGFNTKTGDVRAEDYSTWERPTIFHASPVCKNASVANENGAESADDMETAEATCRAISALRPRVFTLENVYGYRNFQSFNNILNALRGIGYVTNYWHINAANYGVPQTRKRLILVAALDFTPVCPNPTHWRYERGVFGNTNVWVGWRTAIRDLIPDLPPSKFTNYQLKRIQSEKKRTHKVRVDRSLPDNMAFIVGDQKWQLVYEIEPIFTIDTRSPAKIRAQIGERIVKMNARAVARFQSFPDCYVLPDTDTLSGTVLGNAVPPLLYQAVLRAQPSLFS